VVEWAVRVRARVRVVVVVVAVVTTDVVRRDGDMVFERVGRTVLWLFVVISLWWWWLWWLWWWLGGIAECC